jgi:hypothetical protein
VIFDRLYEGPQTLIEDLEDRIKGEFHEYLFSTGIGRYEWILEEVPYEQVKGWVDWEITNSYNNQIKHVN